MKFQKRWILIAALAAGLVWITVTVLEQVNSISPAASPVKVFTAGVSEAAIAPTTETYLPLIAKPVVPTPTSTPMPTPTQQPTAVQTAPPTSSQILESFEGVETTWKVSRDVSGSGSVVRNNGKTYDGSYAALVSSASAGSKAQVRVNIPNEAASAHNWGERPGTWYWQRTGFFLPSATAQQLGANEYITVAGLWPSAGGTYGWWLRVRQNGQMYVFGYDADGKAVEFKIFGVFPQDQWVELTLGLHSQSGPGVKRAFAFLLNGAFYGWYHQGHMQNENYDRAAVGILDTNSARPLQAFVDVWRNATTGSFPDGPDGRSTTNVQEQDYRNLSGQQWQIDWSTWGKDLRLDPHFGLFSATERLQSGRNLDRMPDLTSGWAEIEVDWPNGTPPDTASGYYSAMVGFRKEINREENLEVIPISRGGGAADLVLGAWVNGGPVELAKWALPAASISGRHILEPGDIIRARWEQVNSTQLNVRASYFDASANAWNKDVINITFNDAAIANNGVTVNFNDGYHKASSITIDSPFYSIRRFKVGTLATYP